VLTIDVYYKIWVIVRTEPDIRVGQLVNKIGQTTGWTQGFVRYINMTTITEDGGHYLDQAYADYGMDDGDSGAPVLLDILGERTRQSRSAGFTGEESSVAPVTACPFSAHGPAFFRSIPGSA